MFNNEGMKNLEEIKIKISRFEIQYKREMIDNQKN